MEEFIDSMLWGDNPKLAEKLTNALTGKTPIKTFFNILSSDKSGWIHGWSQWEFDFLWEEIIDWFCSLPINIEDDMSELDDDCPLCRMMKEGVNDLETLKAGFEQVNDKQKIENMFRRFREKDNKT